MKNRIRVVTGLLFFLTVFTMSAKAEVPQENFSADVVTSASNGETSMKMYTTGQKSRMEMPQATMIIRRDLNVMWMIMPSQNMYIERPIDASVADRTSRTMPGELERAQVGTELIDGKTAKKFKITYETAGKRDSVYQWTGDDGFPLRTQAIDGSWTVDFKNVSNGPQPDSLFEPPAGFQKMAMPSLANAMQQGQAAAQDDNQ